MPKVLLIDPFERVVTQMEIENSNEALMDLLDCDKLTSLAMSQNDALITDADYLHVPDQAFWKFVNGDVNIGGRAVIVTAPELPPLSAVGVIRSIQWLDIEFVGIERIDLGPIEHPDHGWLRAYADKQVFRPREPLVVNPATPEPPKPEEAATERPPLVWTIFKDKDTYTAVGFELHASGATQTKHELQNEDLVELRGMLPRNLRLLPSTPNDDPKIVESWA